jgi:transposase-like protein
MAKKTRKYVKRTPDKKAQIVKAYDTAPRGKKQGVLKKFNVGASQVFNWRKQAG